MADGPLPARDALRQRVEQLIEDEPARFHSFTCDCQRDTKGLAAAIVDALLGGVGPQLSEKKAEEATRVDDTQYAAPLATAAENELVPTTEQSEDVNLVRILTAIVRDVDAAFQRVGGSSRHWVRDCFLPALNRAGWRIVSSEPFVCAHCGEPLKQDGEGRWIDAETHGSCRSGRRKHEAVPNKAGEVAVAVPQEPPKRTVTFPDVVSVKMLETELTVLRPKLEACAPYLKDGETPAQCLARNRADIQVLLGQIAALKLEREEVTGAGVVAPQDEPCRTSPIDSGRKE